MYVLAYFDMLGSVCQ